MQVIFSSVLPIILALVAGYGLGFVLPKQVKTSAAKLLTPLIWLLLFFCGKEFGQILDHKGAIEGVLKIALIFAVATSLIPWCLIMFFTPKANQHAIEEDSSSNPSSFLHAVKDCLIALGMVAGGALIERLNLGILNGVSASQLLYVLILIVGVEMSDVVFGKSLWKQEILIIPILVIIGSAVGGVSASFITGEALRTSLALSSGFGWVTLSSLLVSSKLGSHYGATAMMIDLFREMIAISMLYLLGGRCGKEAIGICGATALDATLPLIKQRCGTSHITLAIVSGFILTMISPLLIVVLLMP